MEFVVQNEVGDSILVISKSELYHIRRDQADPFDSRPHFTIVVHYSSRALNALERAHSIFEISYPEHKLRIGNVDIDKENPFIIIKANSVEVM